MVVSPVTVVASVAILIYWVADAFSTQVLTNRHHQRQPGNSCLQARIPAYNWDRFGASYPFNNNCRKNPDMNRPFSKEINFSQSIEQNNSSNNDYDYDEKSYAPENMSSRQPPVDFVDVEYEYSTSTSTSTNNGENEDVVQTPTPNNLMNGIESGVGSSFMDAIARVMHSPAVAPPAPSVSKSGVGSSFMDAIAHATQTPAVTPPTSSLSDHTGDSGVGSSYMDAQTPAVTPPAPSSLSDTYMQAIAHATHPYAGDKNNIDPPTPEVSAPSPSSLSDVYMETIAHAVAAQTPTPAPAPAQVANPRPSFFLGDPASLESGVGSSYLDAIRNHGGNNVQTQAIPAPAPAPTPTHHQNIGLPSWVVSPDRMNAPLDQATINRKKRQNQHVRDSFGYASTVPSDHGWAKTTSIYSKWGGESPVMEDRGGGDSWNAAAEDAYFGNIDDYTTTHPHPPPASSSDQNWSTKTNISSKWPGGYSEDRMGLSWSHGNHPFLNENSFYR